MNLLRVSFIAGSHKTFRHMLRSCVSSNVNIMIRGFATTAGNLESEQVVEKMNSNTMMNDMSKAEEPSHAVFEVLDRTRRVKGLSPKSNETTYTSLMDSLVELCIGRGHDDAYRVLNEMFDSGITPSFDVLELVFSEFLRDADNRKASEVRQKIYEHNYIWWKDDDTGSWYIQCLSDEVTYTSLINAFLDEGKFVNAERFIDFMELFGSLPESVLYSVFINGLDNKARTTEVKKYILKYNYRYLQYRPLLEFHHTLAENCSDDEFKYVVELVEGICIKGLENVFDTMSKLNYKPDGIDDGIVYNLFVIAHCRHDNVDEAYIMYKEMVHHGFACHMFTVFPLILTLKCEKMVNELLWVIQNVLRSCNLNDSEIVKFLNEFNPKKPVIDSEALFNVLAENAKDGPFLKCSYAPASA